MKRVYWEENLLPLNQSPCKKRKYFWSSKDDRGTDNSRKNMQGLRTIINQTTWMNDSYPTGKAGITHDEISSWISKWLSNFKTSWSHCWQSCSLNFVSINAFLQASTESNFPRWEIAKMPRSLSNPEGYKQRFSKAQKF